MKILQNLLDKSENFKNSFDTVNYRVADEVKPAELTKSSYYILCGLVGFSYGCIYQLIFGSF